jgi:hypothetical protein
MIAGQNAIFQTFLGTLFTWGLTALGAALVGLYSHQSEPVSKDLYSIYFINPCCE